MASRISFEDAEDVPLGPVGLTPEAEKDRGYYSSGSGSAARRRRSAPGLLYRLATQPHRLFNAPTAACTVRRASVSSPPLSVFHSLPLDVVRLNRRFQAVAALLLVLLLTVCARPLPRPDASLDPGGGGDDGGGSSRPGSPGSGKDYISSGVFPRAAVATDDARCSAVGRDALAAGGNAVDAAIASCLCLGVVHPHSSGLGGGAFLIVHLANGTSEVIDGRETAPAASTESMFASGPPELSVIGGLAVAVPAELAALHLAWVRHGRLPWPDIVSPAATIAASGFSVDGALAAAIEYRADALRQDPRGAAAEFLGGGGMPIRPGDILTRPRLAATLHAIAKNGPGAFYSGAVAEDIAGAAQARGGVLTASDLGSYRALVRPPVRARALGVQILSVGPPSSGGAAVGFILQFLGGYETPLAALGGLGWHRLVEAFKHAFALRMRLSDPAFDPGGLSAAAAAAMADAGFAAELRANTSDDWVLPLTAYGGRFNALRDPGRDAGTSSLSVIDGEGNAVAVTTTVNQLFGSVVMGPRSGVLLNCQMDDFSVPGRSNGFGLPPSSANFVAPGKRPLSSMAPTIALTASGRVRAVIGASGGPRIITAVASVLESLLARGLTPAAAVAAPRLHHQLLPPTALAESLILFRDERVDVSGAVIAALVARGQAVNVTRSWAAVQLVAVDPDTGEVHAACDRRKGGAPAGL